MQDMTAKVADSPKGWTLPSKDQIDSLSGGIDGGSSTYVSSFSPVTGGGYYNAALFNETTHGYWWGNAANNDKLRYRLGYTSGNLHTYNGSGRFGGSYIRCIQAS
ncbi:hypothetical protein IKF84_00425 [Candidatus Saccharibacteria bacterium]|nr:hypothetical protein [Candidatus Saccharibacteria bacterium]